MANTLIKSNRHPYPPMELVKRNNTETAFVELLGRSHFSFLKGASSPDEMVETAIALEYSGLCLVDVEGLYGIVRGHQTFHRPSLFSASRKPIENFSYHFGAEFTLNWNNRPLQIALLPMTKLGYAHLCQIITRGKNRAPKGEIRVLESDLRELNEDLIAFYLPSDEPSMTHLTTPPQLTHQESTLESKLIFFHSAIYQDLDSVFGDRLYIPVWRDLTWSSRRLLQEALALEAKCGARLFATNRPWMHTAQRKTLHDVMSCIRLGTQIESLKDQGLNNSERHLKSLEDLQNLWKDRADLLSITLRIRSRLQFSLSEIRYRYPSGQIPQGQTATGLLRTLAFRGLQSRCSSDPAETTKTAETPEHKTPASQLGQQHFSKTTAIGKTLAELEKQMQRELDLIAELQYEDYFLTLYEICEHARTLGILFQGRGSAANSVVCFALGLTAVDPRHFDLFFERFLSRERGEPPDIDIDFEHERREQIIQHIYEKYGTQRAGMVCTIIRFKSRLAFREVAKVFGLSIQQINTLSRRMGREGLKGLLENELPLEQSRWKLIISVAREMIGTPRHIGIHTGGFVISQFPLHEIVPIETARMKDRYVVQWNKDDISTLGLMKIDLLSLGMLSALRKAFSYCEQKGQKLSLYNLPYEDSETFKCIQKADTVGVFQIESRAQMNTLPRLKPITFYDLVIEIALIRPGPMQGGMVHPFLRRRQGLEKVEYAHPALREILGRTLGVPIFQEQIMRMAVAVAGFSPGESDELRRLMAAAWRGKGVMTSVRDRVMDGLRRNGLAENYCEQIYRTIEGFANYGFPESHAASFAHITYASSYLKAHHPDVFVCALLNSQPMGFYPPRVLLDDAKRHGVEVLPLDVQHSKYDFSLEIPQPNNSVETVRQRQQPARQKYPVRVGLRSLDGIAKHYLQALEFERELRGIFKSLTDLVSRVQLPKFALMKLAAAGALRCFAKNPRELLWTIESLITDPESLLFGQHQGDDKTLPQESAWQQMIRETRQIGFSENGHPLAILRPHLKNWKTSRDLQRLANRTSIGVVGLKTITQKPPTAKGFCFITLEDEFGFMNLILKPDIYTKFRRIIYDQNLLLARGTLEKMSDVINIQIQTLSPIEQQIYEVP